MSDDEQLQFIREFSNRGIDYYITDDPVRLQKILTEEEPSQNTG